MPTLIDSKTKENKNPIEKLSKSLSSVSPTPNPKTNKVQGPNPLTNSSFGPLAMVSFTSTIQSEPSSGK
jgi:hypothetical protein